MACLVEHRESNEIINKDRVHLPSFKMEEEYKFKYTPESHFKHVVKNVQRLRRKEDEERIWMSFVKEQELSNLRFSEKDIHPSIKGINDLLHDNMQDVDRELKRLQEDTLPERNKGICICKSNNRDENTANIKTNSIQNYSPKQKSQIRDRNECDANILIPITQEDNVTNCQDPKAFKKVLRSKTKKSVSDSSIIRKKHYTNQFLRATNHLIENDSDSDMDLSNDKIDTVHIQADPLTIHKILSMQKKISELLNEISFRLSRIPLPDGNNDLKRRQQQTMEFAIRFSRNYLYNLNRLVTSIQRHIGAISTKTRLQHYHRSVTLHRDMIKQKLIAAHQLLIQALNAYCKHIPNSTSEGHSTKLQNVLQIVGNLRDICNKVDISANHFCSGDMNASLVEDDLQADIDTILSKLKLSLECKEQPASHKNIEPTTSLTRTSLQNGKQTNKKNLSSRLSMYSIDVPKTNQRKNTELRGKKHGYQGEKKYKVEDVRNVHSQQFTIPELLYPSPATHTSSSKDTVLIDCTKKANYSKDDDIKTMMDEIPIDSENDSNIEIRSGRSNIVKMEQSKGVQKKSFTEVWKSKSTKDKETDPKVQNVLNDDDLVKKVTTITKEHLSTLVPVISDLMTLISKKKTEVDTQPISETSMGTLMEFLQKHQSPKDFDTKTILTDAGDKCSYFTATSLSEVQKHNNNVQLICMSSVDKTSETKQRDVSCQADETALKILSDTRTPCSITKHKLKLTTSEETKQRTLAYRYNYKKVCQSRPMYSSNTQNKPWDIVAWISDKLIEELIKEVTKDLGVNDLIQKLYDMEFQEF
ncbi:uncharacterized protein LOC116428343 isoform X2 [Nomia melanderi]|uniref:uncharacterized protein LOC116428343 isoform X2 n=1 Tax=Nomia melanderi TaxID=2448451 RepID=UPI0013045893|nr:uncharacterized protein LOC116428343 isoform X2 [Nomia melanderi]